MTYARMGSFHQVRLHRGEDVVEQIVEYVRRRRLGSGVITGIGAADRVVLGLFDPEKKDYVKQEFTGDWEIVSLMGNVARADREPVCHLHAVIADREQNCRGGHLYAARVSVTCELTLQPGDRIVSREEDPETGLKLLALPFSDDD